MSWLVHPGLLLAGAAAMLLPILIHLFHRRRYQVVDWAAMEFLLAAERQNRRRIQLEEQLLLALRCLAVFLIGMLLARPFVPAAYTPHFVEGGRFERIFVLDDSLSMQAIANNQMCFDLAQHRLLELTTGLAHDRADNSLSLLITSRPDRLLLTDAPLRESALDEIQMAIKRLEPSYGLARWTGVLETLQAHLATEPAEVNRVVYLFTDLRRRDWVSPSALFASLKELANAASLQELLIIDAGSSDTSNLTIMDVKPDGTLVAGVPAAFDVTVKNHGPASASNVRVKFGVQDAQPLETVISDLAPGETSTARFNLALTAGDNESVRPPPRQLKAELEISGRGADDRLSADSVACFPARLSNGIRTLLIDGDASPTTGLAESFYLRRALRPSGPVLSGIDVEVIPASEFDAANVEDYRVLFLLNCGPLGLKSEENVHRLERWLRAGRGLAIFPGDRTDPATFNRQLWRDASGVAPLPLATIAGDETAATWTSLVIRDANHPLTKPFASQSSALLANEKFFRWWRTAEPGNLADDSTILAHFGDSQSSPAIVQKNIGKGRVVAFTIPANADWHDWPKHPSYVLLMQELVRYLADAQQNPGVVTVGQPIRDQLDLADYQLDAKLTGPQGFTATLQATPPPESNPPQLDPPQNTSANSTTIWRLASPPTPHHGFYNLQLTRRDGTTETRLFAANVDPDEGDLTRADLAALQKEIAGTKIRLLSAEKAIPLNRQSQRAEIWRYVFWLLVAALISEQLLAWHFGRRRS